MDLEVYLKTVNLREVVLPVIATLSVVVLGGLVLIKKATGDVDTRPVVAASQRHLLPRTPVEGVKRLVELGVGERQYIRLATHQPGGNRIYLIATVNGPRLTREKLEYAALCIQRIHPLLRCRVKRVNGKVVAEEDHHLRLNVVIRERKGPETCRQVFHDEIEKVPVEIGDNAGSPHTLFLFQNPSNGNHEETCEIVLDLAHFAIDGAGLAPLMHEVLKYTLEDGLPLPAYGSWPIAQCVALDRVLSEKHSWVGKMLAKARMLLYYIWVSSSQRILHLPRTDSFRMWEYGHQNSTYCCRQALNEKDTSALIAKCKSRQLSVTAAVTAAYVEACAELTQPHYGETRFRATVNICADSRRIYSAPATDLSPHVYGAPLFSSEPRLWLTEKNDPELTWELASNIKDHIRKVTADPVDVALQAYWLPTFFRVQPLHLKSPMLNVSSWCASAPVQRKYNSDKYAIEDVELLQNLSYHSWVNISMYTFIGKLNISMLVPVPRFDPKLVKEVFELAKKKVHALIESPSPELRPKASS